MQVAFAQQQELISGDLNLVPVVGAEQNPISRLHRPNMVADRQHLGPDEALGQLRGRWDQDATGRAALTFVARLLHEHPIVQHLDR